MKNLDYSDLDKLFQATTIFALRFLGYEYRHENKDYDDFKNYQLLLDNKDIPEDEFLPTLFCLQRYLSKAQVTREDKEYKIFFKLASKCIEKDADIPEKYQNESYCDEWEKIKGDADEIKKAIAKIH